MSMNKTPCIINYEYSYRKEENKTESTFSGYMSYVSLL